MRLSPGGGPCEALTGEGGWHWGTVQWGARAGVWTLYREVTALYSGRGQGGGVGRLGAPYSDPPRTVWLKECNAAVGMPLAVTCCKG